MTNTQPAVPAFRKGDEVELAEGTYQGTRGVFLQLTSDPFWAEITQANGIVRIHPMAWLAHRRAAA